MHKISDESQKEEVNCQQVDKLLSWGGTPEI
jgi:hypothetical protein